MTTDSKSPSGANLNASSATDEIKKEQIREDKVAYETYARLLDQRKKDQDKLEKVAKELEAFKTAEKERADEALRQKEDWKTLVSQKEEELKTVKSELTGIKTSLQDGSKINAVLNQLQGKVSEAYFQLFDLSKVAMNPDTGTVDEASAQRYAMEFTQKYPELIKNPSNAKMPNDAAKGSGGKLTRDEWLKLPLKEKKARLNEVIGSVT